MHKVTTLKQGFYRKKVGALTLAAFVCLVVFWGVWTVSYHEDPRQNWRQRQEVGPKIFNIEKDEHTATQTRHPSASKADRPVIDNNLTQLESVQSACNLVIEQLRNDEKSRTVYVGLTETVDSQRLEFSTTPRSEFLQYVSEIANKVASDCHVSQIAVKSAIQDQVASFDIPEASFRKTSITLPTNSREEIEFFSGIPKDSHSRSSRSYSFVGRIEVGSVPDNGGKKWRFSHFLELAGIE